MGLRTASVRRPHVEVMAPALTEPSQTQNFDIATKDQLESSPISDYEDSKQKLRYKEAFFCSKSLCNINNHLHVNGEIHNSSESLICEKTNRNNCLTKESGASDIVIQNNIMNSSPTSMGDQNNEMGLQKNDLDISVIHKEKVSNDMDQLFNSLSSVLPDAENVCSTTDLVPNVEEIMQVIKSMEGNDRLNNASNDLTGENEEIFPIPCSDLTNNLSSFEKELLENVDVMNITMEDQHDDLETEDKQKESQAKGLLKELQTKHAKVERRLDFLRRRVYKLESRLMGQHVSGEIAGAFENIHRLLKRPDSIKQNSLMIGQLDSADIGSEKLKPMSFSSTKTLVKKLEMTAILQANSVSRQKAGSKYFGSGSVEVPTFRNNLSGMVNVAPWSSEAKCELQKVTGQLKTQLSIVQSEVDSEATESSSGGESCDEMHSYNNPHQQYLSVQKRALWRYSTDRAVIAARWTWLQAQIADLEYRIRQHTDLHKQIRMAKGPVQLGGASPTHPSSVPSPQAPVNGYRGQLPGSSPVSTKTEPSQDYQCSRTRPLVSVKKRKLLQISGLHAVSKKAARPSTMRCGCVPSSGPCVLCTGRTDPTDPRSPPDTLSRAERVALLDPSFHPVFSLHEDVSQNIHLEALMKTSEWQQRSNRMKTVKLLSKSDSKSLELRTKKLEHRKKYGRLLKPSTMSALSAKIKNKIRGRKPGNRLHRKRFSEKEPSADLDMLPSDVGDEEVESIGNNSNAGGGPRSSLDSPSSSPLLQMQSISSYNKKNRIDSYDIDNIVIPYSVAAATRVEKLQYKEILTPKWRLAELDYESLFDKTPESVTEPSQDSDTEDLTEEAVIHRHDKSEYDEKKRFLSYLKFPMGYGRPRSHRRTDSRAESSGANTPDPMSPPNAADLGMDGTGSPMTSPPATPLSMLPDENNVPQLPSIAVMRRRTISQSRFARERELKEDVQAAAAALTEVVEVAPFDQRDFPIDDDTYDKMLKSMPENHQFQTNTRSQDSLECDSTVSYLDRRPDSPDSESTESAIGDGEEEDPNDPEWMEMERANRERYKR